MATKYITETDTITFGFATNDPATGAADDADSTPSAFVREAGATASNAPITTGVTVSLLSHASYPAGCYEVSINGTTASLAADKYYEVYVSATVNTTLSVAHIGTIVTTPLMDASGIRTAVGLASANLDTQLGDIPTVSEFNARTFADPSTVALEATLQGVETTLSEWEDGTTKPQVNVVEISADSIAADNLEALLDGTGGALLTDDTLSAILLDTGTTLDGKLNTIDDFLDTEIAAIKAKTDQLTFSSAGFVDSNVMEVNDNGGLTGDGGTTPVDQA